ncbi:MAG TPA: penicillin-binding transpeptidase domain-containing protein [Flavobacteriales bacterium]|nr:penicillin-binding transpeptidase domain-containing protein [Flavobacteriales bacterium]
MRAHLLLPLLLACGQSPAPAPLPDQEPPAATHELRDDLAHLYADQQVSGSFILHDLGRDHWVYIDSAQADVGTLPASSFKIFSSLYGLESGVVKDADFVIPWDSVDYGRSVINRDLSLRESIVHSAYWYHREVARRAGAATLKHWLDTVGYGNADTTGGFDRTWVAGALRITPREQVHFLERLVRNELPFSQRSMDIVKDITQQEDTLGYRLHGKTGWAMGSEGSIGWFVGWVEKDDGSGPYVFANRCMTPDTLSETFGPARRAISVAVLKELGVMP